MVMESGDNMKKKSLTDQLKQDKNLIEGQILELNDNDQTEYLIEMTNLREDQTGIPGVIYISIKNASHGPRVKYYQKPNYYTAPNFTVTIEDSPKILNNSLPLKVVSSVGHLVIEWVKLNQQPLTDYWYQGHDWTSKQRNEFETNLKKIQGR